MFTSLLAVVVFSWVLCLPSLWVASRRGSWFLWDTGTLLLPFGVWWLFGQAASYTRGPITLEIDLLMVALLVPIALFIRVFIIDPLFNQPLEAARVVFTLALTSPLLARILVPHLGI